VRSLRELLEIYFQSVGGNATFLLNIPPDTRGRFHENDTARLAELGDALRAALGKNLATFATFTATESLDEAHQPENAQSSDRNSFWRPCDGTECAAVTLEFAEEHVVDKVMLMEHIVMGQRIESFTLSRKENGAWLTFFSGEVVGYKRICRFSPIHTNSIRISVEASRGFPTLAFVGAYRNESP